MRRLHAACLFVSVLIVSTCPSLGQAQSEGDLSPNKIFRSERLGYDLHYRVYLPDNYASLESLPVVYITDGQWYIYRGKVDEVMDRLIADELIEPAIAVFIDNRDPYNPGDNRRNRQFFCNKDYIHFVEKELAPFIDSEYNTRPVREGRVILGLSFGGLNSACFGLYASDSFQGIAMQSPAIHPVRSLLTDYAAMDSLDLRVFLSTGTINDNVGQARRLRDVLEDKGTKLEYVEVDAGHDWSNWQPLIDDILSFYFGLEAED